jgi:hypothetical protein
LRHWIAVLALASVARLGAQDSIASRTVDRRVFKQYEDQLSRVFESLRRENRAPKLSRIPDRQDLRELVCTAALNDANPYGENSPANLMYKTPDPFLITEDLKSISRFKAVGTPPDSRYAVAVWPGIDKKTGKAIYWVGVGIYTSAFFEFVDNTFTDNRPYRNDWQKLVAPSCRNAR